MPVLSTGRLAIDYLEQGQGEPVVLLHSSVSGNRQWRALGEALADRYRALAVNLFGYGDTTPWPANTSQSLYAQACLVLPLIEKAPRIHLVGHSFGAAVALKAALLLGERLGKLVLIEPNPFSVLRQEGRTEAFLEARALRDHVKCFGSLGDWDTVAERFADYWLGDGAWAAMPEKRRTAFAAALPPNFYEWDAVMSEETTLDDFKKISAQTPHWRFHSIAEGGHMAPLTRPELVNPVVRRFLDKIPA